METARIRIGYVDGLRAVAVLSLIASNLVVPAQLGFFGLSLFFVLSGFCLAHPVLARLARSEATAFDVPGYAAARIVRIVPPYYAALIVLFLCAAFVPGFGAMSALDLARKALFVDPNTVSPAGAQWSLAIYLRWYFLFPIALWLWTRSPRAFGVVLLAAAGAGIATRAASLDLIALPAFLSGIVAAHVKIHGHRLVPLALPVSALALLLAALQPGVAPGVPCEVGVFALVVAAGALPWFGRILALRCFTPAGYASYSIALVGAPAVLLAEARAAAPLAAALAGIAAGFVFWFVAERPFVAGTARVYLLARLEAVCTRFLPRVGIGEALRLRT